MKTLKKTWNIVSTALVVLVVLCAVLLMGSRLLGYQVFTVVSGSMEPTYCVGDLIYVEPVDPHEIEVGDPITFVLDESLVVATHRVVEVDEANQHFYTMGDYRVVEVDEANQHFYTMGDYRKVVDPSPVHFNNVIGVVKFSIPKLGYVSDFIQNPPGMYITIAACAVLIILVFLPDMLWKKKKEEAQQSEEEPKQD